MQVDLHTDPSIFDRLHSEWDDLLARAPFDTLFLRPAWLKAWWQVFGPDGALRLLTVRADDGRLLGVAPFFLADCLGDATEAVPNLSYERPVPTPAMSLHPTLLFVGGTEVSDYLDVVVDRQHAAAVCDAVWEAMVQQVRGWEWLDLHCLPPGSAMLQVLPEAARRSGLQVSVVQEDVCPTVELPDTWDAYLALLDKKDRHELRRKMRRAQETGEMRVLEARDPDTLDDLLAHFMALHQASTPDKADFMRDPRMKAFFATAARTALQNGWLDLSFLELGGRLAATFFCFRYNSSVLVYNSGFDPQAWPSLAPGVVLLGHRIRQAIEAGCRELDFLQGNERYKYDLGALDRPIYRIFARQP
ncbi:MAG: GNAT family N-acetyltransferase [Anaerolineae bacterium]